MKGSDQIVDPLLTKGWGSDRRSEKKGSYKCLLKEKFVCQFHYWYNQLKNFDPSNHVSKYYIAIILCLPKDHFVFSR